jgi:6-pyruvoyltetrahydropterin/6-carboxytetrahydropterin synthase
MFELVLQVGFAAAHNLRGYHGNCEKLHGHNWQLDIYLRSNGLDDQGMVLDFKLAKQHLKPVLEQLDHQYLNDIDYFREKNPTTENIAQYVAQQLAVRLPKGIRVDRVTAWESEHCGATYWGETA